MTSLTCSASAITRGVWLVNRNLDFFRVDTPNIPMLELFADLSSKVCLVWPSPPNNIAEVSPSQGVTVLDGEVIQTPSYDSSRTFVLAVGAPCLIIFDAVCINGHSVKCVRLCVGPMQHSTASNATRRMRSLVEREKAVVDHVIVPFHAALKRLEKGVKSFEAVV